MREKSGFDPGEGRCTGQTGLRVWPVERYETPSKIFAEILGVILGAGPRPLGDHQQVFPNLLPDLKRTESRVAAEGSHIAGLRPAMFGSENLSTASLRRSGCFPAEPCPPEETSGRGGCREAFRGVKG